jgi:hypothetical protein
MPEDVTLPTPTDVSPSLPKRSTWMSIAPPEPLMLVNRQHYRKSYTDYTLKFGFIRTEFLFLLFKDTVNSVDLVKKQKLNCYV